MDYQESEFTSNEITPQSVSEQFKLTTDPNLKQVQYLCASLMGKHDMSSAAISEASGSRRNETTKLSSDNQYDNWLKRC